MRMSQKTARECSSCGKLTKYICIDCLIEGKGFVPLCQAYDCKIKHEMSGESKTA